MSCIRYHDEFDDMNGREKSAVFEIFPKVFKDGRGFFVEVAKEQLNWSFNDQIPLWFSNLHWVKQINRSSSSGGVVRGCHAQSGQFCQAKLVQALTAKVFDIITDARPDSKTFGTSTVVVLDPVAQNQLFVPRGFLHGFAVPRESESAALFEYLCDNVYDKDSETNVNPMSLVPLVVQELKSLAEKDAKLMEQFQSLFKLLDDKETLSLSEKDMKAPDYTAWCQKIKDEYRQNRKLWYM